MSASLGFGTENLIFVPTGNWLRVHDIYEWRQLAVDVLRTRVRIREGALTDLDMQIEDALRKLSKRKKSAGKVMEFRLAAEEFVASIRGENDASAPDPRVMQIPVPGLTFWIRVTDIPAESFFSEDYEESTPYGGPVSSLPVYGSFYLKSLGSLEIPFPGTGPAAAFELLIPGDGLQTGDLDDFAPLPLVNEYCGATGVSARGNSVNINLHADIATAHLGSVPMGRIGEKAYATLYFSQNTEKEFQVVERLARNEAKAALAKLERNGFNVQREGTGWRIFQREHDIIHFYEELEGRESAGIGRLPAFLLAASANGDRSPGAREALLRESLAAIRA